MHALEEKNNLSNELQQTKKKLEELISQKVSLSKLSFCVNLFHYLIIILSVRLYVKPFILVVQSWVLFNQSIIFTNEYFFMKFLYKVG